MHIEGRAAWQRSWDCNNKTPSAGNNSTFPPFSTCPLSPFISFFPQWGSSVVSWWRRSPSTETVLLSSCLKRFSSMSSIQTTLQTCTTASRRKFAGSLNATCWWSAPSISSCVRSEEMKFHSQLEISCLCLPVPFCVRGLFSHNQTNSFPSVMLLILNSTDLSRTLLFFVNYTKTDLSDCTRGRRDIWALLTWWKQSDSVFNHSILAQTAKRKKMIIWRNYWFPRCSCLVCKRLQLCMCSAGSVSLPFSSLFKQDKVRQLNEGEEPKSEPVGVPEGTSLLFVCVCLTEAGRKDQP